MEEKKELKPEELKPEELENVSGGYDGHTFICNCGYSTKSSRDYSEHMRQFPDHKYMR